MKSETISKNSECDIERPVDFRDKFLCGDCLATMKTLPDESVDLVVTSPPYNLKNSTGNGMKDGRGGKWSNARLINGYSHHNDCMPHDEYVKWQRECLAEMFRLIKNDGAIFYNHKWRVQAGILQDRQDIVSGFPVRQIIIWRRKGGINFNKGYFLPTYEVIYMNCKPDFVLAKGANSHGDVWEFMQEMKNEHPAPFPVALIERIIGSTNANLILDPFMGSGTTAIAAKKYPVDEMSFRQTINAGGVSDRGFSVKVDRIERKASITFDKNKISDKHVAWHKEILSRGGGQFEHHPYWGYDDLFHKAGTKLHNCFFVRAESKSEDGKEFFLFSEILMLKKFSLEKFIDAIESGGVYIDFDARTGHNHGTKFRIRDRKIPNLYAESINL